MPLYEFKCYRCDYEYSKLKMFSKEKHLEPCPKCGALNEKRLGNIAHFEFKEGMG